MTDKATLRVGSFYTLERATPSSREERPEWSSLTVEVRSENKDVYTGITYQEDGSSRILQVKLFAGKVVPPAVVKFEDTKENTFFEHCRLATPPEIEKHKQKQNKKI